jgi:hypothetical protein
MNGENPQNQYGGPPGSQQAREMTLRWRSEYGGFLGLRPADLAYMTSERSMKEYEPPSAEDLEVNGVEAHFLGQYMEWDSHRNSNVAQDAGMEVPRDPPGPANWWPHENLDNAQTGIHDHMMWRKYGYGRAAAQLSVDVRAGKLSRAVAMQICRQIDGVFPERYAGVNIAEVLEHVGITRKYLNSVMDQFTNWQIMRRVVDDENATPILI